MISLEEKVFWPFRILVLYELKFINSLITILSFVLYLTFTTTRQETEDISIPLVLIPTGLIYISYNALDFDNLNKDKTMPVYC